MSGPSWTIDPSLCEASTLPAAAYRDPAWLERQRERVLARSWQLLEPGGALAPGEARPVSWLPGVLDEPLLRTCDADGVEHLLSNVCTHRLSLVCPEPRTGLRTLRCGYHGRRFRLSGAIVSAPGFRGACDFPRPEDDLPRAALEPLGPLRFAAIDPAWPLEALLDPVRARVPEAWWDALPPLPTATARYAVEAHWALYVDNYLEGLHVPFVHPGLARRLDLGAYRSEPLPWGSVQTAPPVAGEPALPGGEAALYFFLFPNTMLNVYPWGLSVNVVRPLAVDRTEIDYRSYVAVPELAGQGAGGDLDTVEREDDAIVELAMRGARSRLARRGRYAPEAEAGVHHFHRLLTALLGDGPAA